MLIWQDLENEAQYIFLYFLLSFKTITLLKIWGHFPEKKEKEEWNKTEVLEVTHKNRIQID